MQKIEGKNYVWQLSTELYDHDPLIKDNNKITYVMKMMRMDNSLCEYYGLRKLWALNEV